MPKPTPDPDRNPSPDPNPDPDSNPNSPDPGPEQVRSTSPMVAPVVGSLILATLGWRASFGALSALTLTFTPTLTLTPTLTPTPTLTLTLTLSARFDIPRGGVARSRLRVIAHDVRSFHPGQVPSAASAPSASPARTDTCPSHSRPRSGSRAPAEP